MDAREYDRIADLLCQIRHKIRLNVGFTHQKGKWTIDHYCSVIENLLIMTDDLNDLDTRGLL